MGILRFGILHKISTSTGRLIDMRLGIDMDKQKDK